MWRTQFTSARPWSRQGSHSPTCSVSTRHQICGAHIVWHLGASTRGSLRLPSAPRIRGPVTLPGRRGVVVGKPCLPRAPVEQRPALCWCSTGLCLASLQSWLALGQQPAVPAFGPRTAVVGSDVRGVCGGSGAGDFRSSSICGVRAVERSHLFTEPNHTRRVFFRRVSSSAEVAAAFGGLQWPLPDPGASGPEARTFSPLPAWMHPCSAAA